MKKIFLSLLCAVALSIASSAFAEDLKVDVAQADAIKSTLQTLIGKSVSITLGQGEAVAGVVEAVGPDAVKLKELTGKEFYSAVVKLNVISSVVYRAK